jgi:hypothetical protein
VKNFCRSDFFGAAITRVVNRVRELRSILKVTEWEIKRSSMSSTVRNPISKKNLPPKRLLAEENLYANSDSDSIIYSDESENDDDMEGDCAFEADTYAGLPDQNSLKKSKNTTESPLHHTTYRAQSQKRKEEETGILSTIKEERGGDDEDESYEESDDSESSDDGSSDSEVID